ncbi:TonB-dependent siderophore receptor [Caldimonas tepidiphila]|uniref:TonB-dependent siderophore receptor n=1 Tax=Caldimonas tepidiphila TaxID=2315841 RepID=UPI000E5AC310|nr:TonB-dependent siderophore receptor [Caldimonas tepidiphila]
MATHSSDLPASLRRQAPVAAAALLALLPLSQALAQASSELPTVTVTGRNPAARAAVTGFGERPLAETPLQASVVTQERLKERGAQRLADLVSLDAGVSDAYNAAGYWDNLTVRGYALDYRYNYRRDGLPISGETSIPLENKSAVEVLKGTSGIQAGTSAPGGLVNYVVKRPEGRVRSLELGWRSRNTRGASLDIGERFGEGEAFGLRVNAAYEHLDSPLRSDEGHRRLLALAADWRLSPDTRLEAEFETSRRSQPSQPGFSLLGPDVPNARNIDPRTNLNNQPWSLPVVMEGNTASLRLQQRLDADWSLVAHAGTQRLHTDDRLAYPFGCTDASAYYGDRYCPNGDFDLYEYRSDKERRQTDALDVGVRGRFATGGMKHELGAGVLLSRHETRLQARVEDFAGTGNISGTVTVPSSPGGLAQNTNRTEESTELYLRDAVQLAPGWDAWLGLRHTRIERESVRTNGSRRTEYTQSFTTPWLALSHRLSSGQLVYASWGQGIESEVAPNRARYTNRGEALPALKSRQTEFGLKSAGQPLAWQFAWFDMRRPVAQGVGSDCGSDTPGNTCTLQADGDARHRGVEAGGTLRSSLWELGGSVMVLDAQRRGSAVPAVNGQRPPNVPEFTAKLQAGHRVAVVPGLRLLAGLTHEGDRMVEPGAGSARIPSWTRIDLGLSHEQRVNGTLLTWRAGVDNVADKRAWRESPYQYEHIYLYPLAPRTWRLSLQADF